MTYGRLEVLTETRRSGRLHYRCLCSCGILKTIRADNVRSGLTVSCGCLGREQASQRLRELHTASKSVSKSTINLPARSRD